VLAVLRSERELQGAPEHVRGDVSIDVREVERTANARHEPRLVEIRDRRPLEAIQRPTW
jgi:hypothetical protein